MFDYADTGSVFLRQATDSTNIALSTPPVSDIHISQCMYVDGTNIRRA